MVRKIATMAVSLSRWIVTSPYDWWVDLVTREFSFLSDAGFRLEKLHIHQEGNFVRYRGGWKVVLVKKRASR